MLHGELTRRLSSNAPPEMQPLVGDLRALLLEYQRERLQDDSSRVSAPDKLRALLHNEVAGDEVLVVSNREPYIHVTAPGGIEVRRPASGLVTAVEAVMRACSGTWIAHGAGNADRDTVDPHDRVTQEQSYPISISWPDTKPGKTPSPHAAARSGPNWGWNRMRCSASAKRWLTSTYWSQSEERNTGRTCAIWHSGHRPSLAKP